MRILWNLTLPLTLRKLYIIHHISPPGWKILREIVSGVHLDLMVTWVLNWKIREDVEIQEEELLGARWFKELPDNVQFKDLLKKYID